MGSISIAVTTWNRASTFVKTMETSLCNTGIPWDEIIWVDNGSHPEQYAKMDIFMSQFERVTRVRNFKNKGMAQGFNVSLGLSRSDYVVLIGPDIIFPEGWLRTYVEYMDALPDAGIVATYVCPIDSVPERKRGHEVEVINGLRVLRAMPFDHPCFRRQVFRHAGYLREDFGLYGWSDVEFMERCEKILPPHGLKCYVIPDFIGTHLAGAGAEEFRKGVDEDYETWKRAEVEKGRGLVEKCRAQGFPYYSPF